MDNLMTNIARQGDVLLRKVPAIPATVKEVPRDGGRVILAYGEVTGHSHAFNSSRVTMFMDIGSGTGQRYLRVADGEPAALEHEEHSTILVPPGDYEIIGQSEYSPEEIRRVQD